VRVTRWALVTLGVLLLLGVVTVALARLFGKPGSRGSVLVSIVSRWLAAYVLWSFGGGLARTYGVLVEYYTPAFAIIALLGAIFEYRARVRAGRERGLAIFVGVQLAWLVFVLLQNGLLTPGW
jgi:hypothetical protein